MSSTTPGTPPPAASPHPTDGPTPGGAPRPEGGGFFGAVRRLGVQRADDRWVAGVCSGVADRLGIDPLVVRGLFVVTFLLSGVGAVAYAIAWALLPERRDGRIHAEELVAGRFDIAVLGAAALLVIGMGRGDNGWWNAGPQWAHGLFGVLSGLLWLAFVVAVAITVLVLVTRHRPPRGPVPPWAGQPPRPPYGPYGSYGPTGPAPSDAPAATSAAASSPVASASATTGPTTTASTGRTAPAAPAGPTSQAPAAPPYGTPPRPGAPAHVPYGPYATGPAPSTAPYGSGPHATGPHPATPSSTPYASGPYASGPYASTPYASGPYSTGPYAGQQRPVTPAPAPATTTRPAPAPAKPRRRGPGATSVGIVVGLALLTFAGLLAADRTGRFDGPVLLTTLGVTALLAGIGVVVAGLRGRSSGTLGFLAIVALLVSVPAGAVEDRSWTWDEAGIHRPGAPVVVTSRTAAADGLRFGAGEATLDLTGVPMTDELLVVPVSVGAGKLSVVVPADAAVEATTRIGLGSATWQVDGAHESASGIGIGGTTFQDDASREGSPQLSLDVSVGAGEVTITREDS